MEHAEKLMDYMNQRGGRVKLLPLDAPEVRQRFYIYTWIRQRNYWVLTPFVTHVV